MAAEEKYRALFESVGSAIQFGELLFDPDGTPMDVRMLDVNPAYEQQTGLRASQVVGRSIKEVLGQVEQSWFDRYAEMLRRGEPIHFEEHVASLDRWFDVDAAPLSGNRFFAVFSDTTERKRAEAALRESEERFRIMADGCPFPLWVTDAQGGNRFVNRAYLDLFGVEAQQVEGSGWQPLVHPEDMPAYLEKCDRAMREHTVGAHAQLQRSPTCCPSPPSA